MRKNKKLLLASVAAMGALALGVGATSTFAWYQVSQSNKLTDTDIAKGAYTVTTENNSSASVQQAYLKITIDLSNATLDLTTEDGQSMGITTEGRQVWYVPSNAYVGVSLTAQSARGTAASAGSKYGFQWYTDAECNNVASPEFVANIKSAVVDVKASAGARVRLTTDNPADQTGTGAANVGYGLDDPSTELTNSKKFYDAFHGTLGAQNVDIGDITVADGGGVTGPLAFYYSIAGKTSGDAIRKADTSDTFESQIANDSTDLQITFTLSITSANPA